MNKPPMWRRYARILGPDPAADVKDELRFHLETKADDLVARGLSPQAARAQAERQFGNLMAVQAIGRKMGERMERRRRLQDYVTECKQDVRYALRTLLRDRGFATVTVLILALGIAAGTAVFSVVNTVLLRPLPFPESQQLAWLEGGRSLPPSLREAVGLSATTFTVSAFEGFQRNNRSFQSVASYNPFLGDTDYAMTGHGEPQPVAGIMVDGNFFKTLGIEAAHGRLFVNEETVKGGRPAVLLSDNFWRRQFASDPTIVGQTIALNKQPMTVVGVLPASFDFGSVFSPGLKMDVYVPLVLENVRNWGNTLSVVGRLRPGVSVQQAQVEAETLMPQLRKSNPDWEMDYTPTILGLKEFVSGKLRRSLIVLWCAVGLIQLIVCVNLTNLLLARGAARSKEFALRTALGAGRGRLIRQLLTESLVLASGGAVLGLAMAFGITIWLAHQGATGVIALPMLRDVRVDGAALGWTLLVTVVTALVFGVIPGLKLSGGNPQEGLKERGPGMSAGGRHERLRAAMVISEMALACVLLVCAGLLMRSFLKILDVDLGFDPSRAATMHVTYEGANNPEHRGVVLREMLRRINAIPGIEAAGETDMLPLGRNRSWQFNSKAHPPVKGEVNAAVVRVITPGYLKAMGMRVDKGRDLSWDDGAKTQPVVVINQATARRFWPGQDAVGKLAVINDRDTLVVGVIADVRENSVEGIVGPEMYLPVTQADPEGGELVIRSKLPASELASDVMATLRSMNPAQPASALTPLSGVVDHAVSPRRFFVLLVAAFAILGLVLAALGIYGVISYSVTRQTQEIGIRMALGATMGRVQRDVLGRAMWLTAIGVGLGTIASFMAAREIASLLFGTEPTDAATYAGIVLLLSAVALMAAYIPARRASRIDPMVALRGE
jgi:predicted permease